MPPHPPPRPPPIACPRMLMGSTYCGPSRHPAGHLVRRLPNFENPALMPGRMWTRVKPRPKVTFCLARRGRRPGQEPGAEKWTFAHKPSQERSCTIGFWRKRRRGNGEARPQQDDVHKDPFNCDSNVGARRSRGAPIGRRTVFPGSRSAFPFTTNLGGVGNVAGRRRRKASSWGATPRSPVKVRCNRGGSSSRVQPS
jgi:hypothetical protein